MDCVAWPTVSARPLRMTSKRRCLLKKCDTLVAQLRLDADYLTAENPGQLYKSLKDMGQQWLQKVRDRLTAHLKEFGVATREAARAFTRRLLVEYEVLKRAAQLQARVLVSLEKEHLSAMGLSWQLLCAHWFHTVVFLCSDVSDCAGELLDNLRPCADDTQVPSAMSLYLQLDSDMSRIGQEWRCAQAVLEGWQERLATAAEPAVTKAPRVYPPSLSSTDGSSVSPGSESPPLESLAAENAGRLAVTSAHTGPLRKELAEGAEDGSFGSNPTADTGSGMRGTAAARDSKYCDCCYCEVFGHGGGQQPTVSSRYLELRELLRQRLQRKKAGVGGVNDTCRASLLTAAADAATEVSEPSCDSSALREPPQDRSSSVPSAEQVLEEESDKVHCITGANGRPESGDGIDKKGTATSASMGTQDVDTLVAYINGPSSNDEKRRAVKKEKRARQKARRQEERVTSVRQKQQENAAHAAAAGNTEPTVQTTPCSNSHVDEKTGASCENVAKSDNVSHWPSFRHSNGVVEVKDTVPEESSQQKMVMAEAPKSCDQAPENNQSCDNGSRETFQSSQSSSKDSKQLKQQPGQQLPPKLSPATANHRQFMPASSNLTNGKHAQPPPSFIGKKQSQSSSSPTKSKQVAQRDTAVPQKSSSQILRGAARDKALCSQKPQLQNGCCNGKKAHSAQSGSAHPSDTSNGSLSCPSAAEGNTVSKFLSNGCHSQIATPQTRGTNEAATRRFAPMSEPNGHAALNQSFEKESVRHKNSKNMSAAPPAATLTDAMAHSADGGRSVKREKKKSRRSMNVADNNAKSPSPDTNKDASSSVTADDICATTNRTTRVSTSSAKDDHLDPVVEEFLRSCGMLDFIDRSGGLRIDPLLFVVFQVC